MRSRRTVYLLLLAAAVLFLIGLLGEPAWLQLVATLAACVVAVSAARVSGRFGRDPNGPRGQH